MSWEEWVDLCSRVECIIRESSEAYIGRSCDPDRRLEDHEMEWDARVMYRVGKGYVRAEVEAVETALIEAMDRFLRLRNVVIDSPGQFRQGLNYIYVAVN